MEKVMMGNGKMVKGMEKVKHIYIINAIGILYINNKVVYNGEWKNDIKDGKGKPHLI